MFGSVWLTVLSSEALLFTISIAFIMLAMAKERAEQSHKHAAMVDPLTGLVNRRGFFQETARVARRQADNPQLAAVLLVDLDNFKSINDRFGHAVGDKVLQIFAETAVQSVRPTDFVGRLGGEEFAAVLHNVGRERAMVIAERMRAAFAEATLMVDGCAVGATASVGMVFSDGAEFDAPELLTQADKALYEAKERGRNRVEVAGAEPEAVAPGRRHAGRRIIRAERRLNGPRRRPRARDPHLNGRSERRRVAAHRRGRGWSAAAAARRSSPGSTGAPHPP